MAKAQSMLNFNLEEQVEDINQDHVGGWNEMIAASNPAVIKTPLTAYMDIYDLKKHVISLSNAKIKKTIGYKLKRPQFSQVEIQELVSKAQADHIWPTLSN
jgi:hypothetical protein